MAEPTRLIVRGIPDDIARARPPVADRFAGIVSAEVKDAVRIERGRAVRADFKTGPVADDDVVEVELEDGVKLWIRGDAIEAELATIEQRGDGDGTVIRIDDALPLRSPQQRGIGTWFLKALRVLDIDLVDKAAELSAEELAERLENKLIADPALYRWDGGELKQKAKTADLEGKKPILLFLHGTGSTTMGSFGGLVQPARTRHWRDIEDAYGDRIVALEHWTLRFVWALCRHTP